MAKLHIRHFVCKFFHIFSLHILVQSLHLLKVHPLQCFLKLLVGIKAHLHRVHFFVIFPST